MLQNSRVAAFTVSELLRENQQGGKIIPTPHTQIISVEFISYKFLITECYPIHFDCYIIMFLW